MKKPILIGLLHENRAWQELLEQIGVPWSIIDTDQPEPQLSYSAIIINRKPTGSEESHIFDFRANGGAILDTVGIPDGFSVRTEHPKFVTPDEHCPLFDHLGIVDLHLPVKKITRQGYLDNTIYIDESGNQPYAFFGIPVESVMDSVDRQRKSFYVSNGIPPNETIQLRSRNELPHILLPVLIQLHRLQGLPLVHKWWYPENDRSLFGFRIDSDHSDKLHINRLRDLLDDNDVPGTWFLHVEAHEDWLDYFHQFRGHEIALHCYKHEDHGNRYSISEDMDAGLSALRKAGFDPKGYTAPYGIWNQELAEAMKKHSFLHSGEFTFDYDNLPSHPVCEGCSHLPLQVPVHPICIGSFLRTKSGSDTMKQYFRDRIAYKLARHEPLFFYHHPLQQHLDVWQDVFGNIRDREINSTTLGQYAEWWHNRKISDLRAYVENDTLFLERSTDSPHAAIHIGVNQFLISDSEQLSLDKVQTQPFYNSNSDVDFNKFRDIGLRKKDWFYYKSELLDRLARWGL